MTVTDCLLILTVLTTPAPHAGYGWRVDDELTARDRAAAALDTAGHGSQAWWDAHIALVGAETRLAALLDVEPPIASPLPALDW
jgi:hypothetical protein